MAFYNCSNEHEHSDYTRRLRYVLHRQQDGYASYGQFNSLPVRWFNSHLRSTFHEGQGGISLPKGFRKYTTVLISANDTYAFLDQFVDINEHLTEEGVFAMSSHGQVVSVPEANILKPPVDCDIAYSGRSQSGNKIGKLNQHLKDLCSFQGVLLVVLTNRYRGESKVLGFYQGVASDTSGPNSHPHKFYLRRIPSQPIN
jgi:hypothetical protein